MRTAGLLRARWDAPPGPGRALRQTGAPAAPGRAPETSRPPRASGRDGLQDLLGDVEVGVDALDVVVVLELVDQPEDLARLLLGDLDGALGDHGQLGRGVPQPAPLERVADGHEVARVGGDLPLGAVLGDVLGAAGQGQLHELVLVHALPIEQHDPLAVELPGDAAGRAQRAAVLGEDVAQVGRGAVAVVGEDGGDHGHAAGPVALVDDRLVGGAVGAAGAALDGALDVVLGHRVVARLLDRAGERRVGVRVGPAL